MLFHVSVNPISCHSSDFFACSCLYNQESKANVYNCSNVSTMKSLPSSVPPNTDWLSVRNNNISRLCGSYSYIKDLSFLGVENNNITKICSSFLDDSKLKGFNLAQNNIVHLPYKIQKLDHLEEVQLSGNPYQCDCETAWMIQWLNTTHAGGHVIVDYKDVKCHSGLMIGTPMYVLDEVQMGCFPTPLSSPSTIYTIASWLVIACLTIIFRKWRIIRNWRYSYLMYFRRHLNKQGVIVIHQQKKYDAYVSYW